MKLVEFVGGRKAAATITVLAVGVGMSLYRGDVPQNLLTLLGWIFTAFVLGNVGAKFAQKPTASGPAQDTAALNELGQMVAQIGAAVATQQQGMTYLVETTQRAEQAMKQQAARNRAAASGGFDPNS